MAKKILAFIMILGVLSFVGCKGKEKSSTDVSENINISANDTMESGASMEEKADGKDITVRINEERKEEISEEGEAQEDGATDDKAVGEKRRIAAYLEGFDQSKDSIFVDEVEWLTLEDTERLEALGIEKEELTDGYFINNPYDRVDEYKLTEETKFYIIDYREFKEKEVSKEEWYGMVTKGSLNWLRLQGSEVMVIEEQYLP